MPPTNPPSSEYLTRLLNQMQNQLNALGQQNQYVVVDQNLKVRVQVGLLENGDFGILLVDTQGNRQELLPTVDVFAATVFATASNTAVSSSPATSLTAVIGASGNFVVTIAAGVIVPGTVGGNAQAIMDLYIDGSAVISPIVATNGLLTAAGNLSIPIYSRVNFNSYQTAVGHVPVLLTPGSHTFELKYRSPTSVSVTFANMSMEVTPI